MISRGAKSAGSRVVDGGSQFTRAGSEIRGAGSETWQDPAERNP